MNIHEALVIAFPKHPLILSLGKILPWKLYFRKKIILTWQLCKTSKNFFYGSQIFPGKIETKLKIRGVFRKHDTKGFVNIQKYFEKLLRVYP